MTTILIALFTVVLLLVCAFMVLIILMQRASSNAGLGSALGGSAMESALGGGAGNVLTRGTVLASTLFFVIAFCLYLAHMATYEGELRSKGALPTIEAVAPEDEAAAEPAAPSALKGALTDTTEKTAVTEVPADTGTVAEATSVPEDYSAEKTATDAEAAAKEAAAPVVEEASEQTSAAAEAAATEAPAKVEESTEAVKQDVTEAPPAHGHEEQVLEK